MRRNARLRQRVSSSSKRTPRRSESRDQNKYAPRGSHRIDLLFVHDLHRPSAKRAAASVRYARMHVNGRRGYRARGSKLKLKRIHRESFLVSRVIRARTVSSCIYRFIRPNVPIVPSRGLAVILRQQSTRAFFALADLPHASIYGFLIKQPGLEFIKEK